MKNDRRRLRAKWLLSAILVLGCALPALAQEAQFIAEESTGLIDATEFLRLEIVGLNGTLNIRGGLPGDLRFTARSLANRREERNLSLWFQDRTLILSAGSGLEGERLLAEIIVPPNLTVTVKAADSHVKATSLGGAFELHGDSVVFEGRALQGSVEIDIKGGSARIQGSQSEVSVTARDADLTLSQLEGYATLDLNGGSALLIEIQGDVTLDTVNTAVTVNLIDGRFQMTSNGGSAELSSLNQGGELNLEGTPVRLKATLGSVEVETDQKVEFREIGADLRIVSYGGDIVGNTTRGRLEISGADFSARIEQVGGALTIEGDELRLALRDLRGNVEIQARASEVSIEAAAGNLVVHNDFGNVTIKKADKAVSVTSSQGNVTITELSGPIQLQADGPEVTVQWLGSARQEDSIVHNESGNVTIMFSAKFGGRLDASTRGGRIESSLAGITVGNDGHSASGFINRLNKPRIQISAGGNIQLSSLKPGRAVKTGN